MAGRKRSEKKEITPKEKRFAQGVASGKTEKRAALDAGYTEAMAENTKQKIWNKLELQEYFKRLMQKAAPPGRIVAKISEHIDGKSVTTRIRRRMVPSTDPEKKGEEVEETVMEKIETVDAGVSLKAIEMAVKINQYIPPETDALVSVGVSLEEAIEESGDNWEPPDWAKRLKVGVAVSQKS